MGFGGFFDRAVITNFLFIFISTPTAMLFIPSRGTVLKKRATSNGWCYSRPRIWQSFSLSCFQTLRVFSSNEDQESNEELDNTVNRRRLGIGGAKLTSPSHAEAYATVIQTALTHRVTTFEAAAIGFDGETSLANAYRIAQRRLTADDHQSNIKDYDKVRPTMLARFGYRNANDSRSTDDKLKSFSNDVSLRSKEGRDAGEHNVSKEYVDYCLNHSPMVKLRLEQIKEMGEDNAMQLIYMAHNPETQGEAAYEPNDGKPPLKDIREAVRTRLKSGFVVLEDACSNGTISSYGVSSNGLSLPSSHPLHMSWKDVLTAARDAANVVHGQGAIANLSTLQLPANLLETKGIQVAKDIQAFLRADSSVENHSEDKTGMPSKVDIYISRPLTCYPDQGTGSGYPFKLVDYQIPIGVPSEAKHPAPTEWSHLISGQPPLYVPALNAAMSHFDAEDILTVQKERELTVEERETLEGCRLLQSMLHDLDAQLDHVRSFQAYEEHLSSKVIPIIHNTFEELDDTSAEVLQAFFMMHGAAVRHAVAKTTRKLLREGGEGVPPYHIPDTQKLQDFALQWLLRHDENIVSKVIVGCPKPQHVMEAVNAADSVLLG